MKNLIILYYLYISNIVQIGLCVSANFTIIPSSQVVAEEQLATFRCQHPHAVDILWLINGSTIRQYPGDATAETAGHPPLHTVYINAHTRFNKSLVQCLAIFDDGTPSQFSPPVELLVQGSLSAVSNLLASLWKSVIYITWEAPFSLNITNTEPDITYCVQIFSNSNNFQILHTHNLTDTEFLYPLQQNISSCCNSEESCNITIIIVPINGAGNGLSAQAHIPSAYDDVTVTHTDVHVINSGRMKATYFILPAGPACNCSLLLWKIDSVNTTYAFNESNGLICEYSTISFEFSADMLPFNSHYKGNISVSLNNLSINISTHDVQNISVDEIDLNTIQLTATFINNSRARGALVVFKRIPDSLAGNTLTVDELQSTFSFIISDSSETSTLVCQDVPSGTYKVLVYDIEENGLLNVPSAMPAVVSTVTTHGRATLTESKSNKPQEVNIAANIFKSFLIINCTYVNEDKIQGCLVLLSSRFSPEQLHVQIQLRDSAFPLVYSVKPNTRHTIAAFAIKEDSGILNSTIYSMDIYIGFDSEITARYRINSNAYIITLGASISISIIIIIVLLTILIIKFCVTNSTQTKRKSDWSKPSTIQMQKCEAYEVLPIRRR